MDSDLVMLRASHSLAEAEVLRSLLASEGIDSVVVGGGLRRPRVRGATPAYRIFVRLADRSRAEEILGSFMDESEWQGLDLGQGED